MGRLSAVLHGIKDIPFEDCNGGTSTGILAHIAFVPDIPGLWSLGSVAPGRPIPDRRCGCSVGVSPNVRPPWARACQGQSVQGEDVLSLLWRHAPAVPREASWAVLVQVCCVSYTNHAWATCSCQAWSSSGLGAPPAHISRRLARERASGQAAPISWPLGTVWCRESDGGYLCLAHLFTNQVLGRVDQRLDVKHVPHSRTKADTVRFPISRGAPVGREVQDPCLPSSPVQSPVQCQET